MKDRDFFRKWLKTIYVTLFTDRGDICCLSFLHMDINTPITADVWRPKKLSVSVGDFYLLLCLVNLCWCTGLKKVYRGQEFDCQLVWVIFIFCCALLIFTKHWQKIFIPDWTYFHFPGTTLVKLPVSML